MNQDGRYQKPFKMKRTVKSMFIGVALSVMASCGKDELPQTQKEAPKKCAGCGIERPKGSDVVTKKNNG